MRRLVQFGTFTLLLACLLVPVVEFFDRWDAAGPGDDTELAVFGLILSLVCVLLVSRLIASRSSLITLVPVGRAAPGGAETALLTFVIGRLVPAQISPPLRV